ncbi:hypothetical protein [Streptomyces sp. NPDC059491]|uniref:hypothetical protein n=1 Tax=Streptomyces sp. NPDC059491 TaxID=3346850 RepID=UPI0036997A53
MIYRHFNAPVRAFTQLSHDIIRHPRLSSDAVRLLTWQLSLPRAAREPLSRTAERARIGACAFTKAKLQLKEEGFLHERRVQVAGGRWITQQLLSSVPLSPEQAVKLLARDPVPAGPERMSPQLAPGRRFPAAGGPVAGGPGIRPTGGHPEEQPGEDTSDLPPAETEAETEAPPGAPPAPAPAPAGGLPTPPPVPAPPQAPAPPQDLAPPQAPAPPESPLREEARALVGVLPLLSPALRNIPPGMREELAGLAARWLEAGYGSAEVHEHVLRGLPGAGTPVHRPGGLVRYLLREVPPRAVPAVEAEGPPEPRLSVRLEGARECAGEGHTQPMLFRPDGSETHCGDCRRNRPLPVLSR